MMTLQIPVRLQKLEKKNKKEKQSACFRKHIGTTYFAEGATANQVCKHIMQTQKNDPSFGLWLLQRIKDNKTVTSADIKDEDFETVKDPKYVLEDGVQYVALHYSGMDIELIL